MSSHDTFAANARFDHPDDSDSAESGVQSGTMTLKPALTSDAAVADQALDHVASVLTRGRRDLETLARLTADYKIETDIHNSVFAKIASATLRRVKLTVLFAEL
jgi:hypothetical protein